MRGFKFLIVFSLLILFSCNIEENQVSFDHIDMCTFDLRESHIDPTTKPNATIIDWPRWKNGQTIKIKFLDGDSNAREKVKKYAAEWTKYANLNFVYVSATEYADIRIGFQLGQPGAWSELGMESTYGTPDHQSMRLGPLTSNSEASVRRTVLHEFGHALGLVHETLNPSASIQWNLPKVYKYYSDLQGWSKEEVDEFVINKSKSTNYSEYDPLSIMHYYINPALTTDGKGVNEMIDLSIIDASSINKWYPFPIRSVIESGERIDYIPWTHPIKSSNNKFILQFISGILSVKELDTDNIMWQEGNSLYSNFASCYLQSDGNLVIKGRPSGINAAEKLTWISNTGEYPGAKLYLQDDGNLELIYNGVVKWSSKIGKTE